MTVREILIILKEKFPEFSIKEIVASCKKIFAVRKELYTQEDYQNVLARMLERREKKELYESQ